MQCTIATGTLTILLLLSLYSPSAGQDIYAYELVARDDVFSRELSAAAERSSLSQTLPKLDCAVEYIRRQNGEDVVYRRGPIDLHQSSLHGADPDAGRRGKQPASSDSRGQVFQGGLLVDLPRAGETDQELPLAPRSYRYMLRTALVPISYKDALLTAEVLLERAVVSIEDDRLIVHGSEVFSRTVELQGNLPLKFDLPSWDASLPEGGAAVPTSLQEAVLITLEIPRHFGLPENLPEPFAARTLLTYAIPKPSVVRLSIRIRDEELLIDEGRREPGTYEYVWNANDLPDDEYTAVFTATDTQGKELFRDERRMVKTHDARNWTGERPAIVRSIHNGFMAGVESGVAYQLPADEARALSNMLTHAVFRLGYRFSASWEAGLLIGQEAFHEIPGPEVDIDRIPDYGGVVGYTYGYAGSYLRWTLASTFIQPYVEMGVGLSSAALLPQMAVGVKAELIPRLEVYLSSVAMFHLRNVVSKKLGFHYGMNVRF
ncbi:MAG: hypothetical protein KFH87_04455 [Bacteroidetes bacterium]|nr:hypothetical protein [Bacteroidota bacterium]